MTIKKRLFLSNLFMLLIPALVSILVVAVSALLFLNLFYKQVMDETVHGENTVHLEHLLVKQAEEFLQTDHEKLSDSTLYQTVEKYIQTRAFSCKFMKGICRSVPWGTERKNWQICRCMPCPAAMSM